MKAEFLGDYVILNYCTSHGSAEVVIPILNIHNIQYSISSSFTVTITFWFNNLTMMCITHKCDALTKCFGDFERAKTIVLDIVKLLNENKGAE